MCLRLCAAPRAMLLVILLAAQLVAQDWGASKPFGEWSKADAERILNESPWVRRQTIKLRVAGRVRRVAGAPNPIIDGQPAPIATEGNTALTGGAEAPVDFTFTLRLRSALPVRQALARLMQFDAKAGKGGDKERAALEARAKGTLDCPACVDNYVLTLTSGSKQSPGADPIYDLFRGTPPEDLKRYVFIANERGERRPLVHFVPPKAPGQEVVLFFSRRDDAGTPLLTPASKKLIFNLTNNEVSLVANFTIDVSEITRGDEVVF